MIETNKILIIDDDPGVRQSLVDIFEVKGYQAIAAGTGREALDVLERDSFILAFVDIELPDIEGLALMRKLKAKAPELACCIMTGYGTMERAIEAIKAGADDFFVKPVNIEQMLHRVKEVLDKRRMQQELIESHLFSRNVLNSIRDDISIIDPSSMTIVEVNDAFIECSGLSKEQIIGRTCHEVTHNLPARCKAPCVCPIDSEDILARSATVEHVHFNTEGQKRYVEITVFPMQKNLAGQELIVHSARDITDRKRVEQELALKNEELDQHRNELAKALDEISRLINTVVDLGDFSVRFENPHLKRCYDMKGCREKNCPCYGDEPVRCWQVMGTFCKNGAKGTFAQKRSSCISCEVFTEATTDPIFLIGEEFNNMMYILEIKNTELKKAFEDLKGAQAQIIQQEKLATIGQLAAGVAHEVNNPVGFITSNLGSLDKYINKLMGFIEQVTGIIEAHGDAEETAELTAMKKKIKLDFIVEDIKDLIQESLDGTNRVKKIVQNLKSFSRSDEQEHKSFDIHECIESALSIAWNELKYKCTVEKDYGELAPVLCYPHQLNQVIMNILVNGAHAIENQGVLSIKTWEDEKSAFVAIADTGCGIPEENLQKIFEPFFTTKVSGKGTGLGMSIAMDIIKKHDGDISVQSEVGKGTTFTIRLPKKTED